MSEEITFKRRIRERELADEQLEHKPKELVDDTISWKDLRLLWADTQNTKGFRVFWRYHWGYVTNRRLVQFAAVLIDEMRLPYKAPPKLK